MSKTTKTLLVLAVIGLVSGFVFVTGMVKVGDSVAWYITLPMGAIFLGLFLISKLLEKEVALHDMEQATVIASPQKVTAGASAIVKPCQQKSASARQVSLVSAH
jgi:ABC-type microcin C transport system permease subunit YejB